LDYLKQTADDLVKSGLFAGIEWQVSKGGKGIFSGKSGFQDLTDGTDIPVNAFIQNLLNDQTNNFSISIKAN